MEHKSAFASNYIDSNRHVTDMQTGGKCWPTRVWSDWKHLPPPGSYLWHSEKHLADLWCSSTKTRLFDMLSHSCLTAVFVLSPLPHVIMGRGKSLPAYSRYSDIVIVSNWPLTSCRLTFDKACISTGQPGIHLDRADRSQSSCAISLAPHWLFLASLCFPWQFDLLSHTNHDGIKWFISLVHSAGLQRSAAQSDRQARDVCSVHNE